MKPVPDSPDPSSVDPAGGSDTSDVKELGELIQMFCQAKRTGLLTFTSGEMAGNLHLHHGQVLHAVFGTIQGQEAVYQMLQWPPGVHQFTEGVVPEKRTVQLTWEQLLFEGALHADNALLSNGGAQGEAGLQQSAPVIVTRIQGGQPKLTIIEGELPAETFDLNREFVYVGRVEGNEIVLPVASVSSRHCIFILKGSDVILRDLNSSNGTLVNGKSITETILQVGDIIQIGFIKLKLESAMKRPKLRSTTVPLTSSGSAASPEPTPFKLQSRSIPSGAKESDKTKDYVTGGAAIVYTDLHVEPPKEPKKWHLKITVILGLAFIVGGVLFYVYLMYK
jgi:FHA domain/Domain of unknown function (DUF4388)